MRFLESLKDHFYAWLIWHKVISTYPGFHSKYDRRRYFLNVTGYYEPVDYYRNEVKEEGGGL